MNSERKTVVIDRSTLVPVGVAAAVIGFGISVGILLNTVNNHGGAITNIEMRHESDVQELRNEISEVKDDSAAKIDEIRKYVISVNVLMIKVANKLNIDTGVSSKEIEDSLTYDF